MTWSLVKAGTVVSSSTSPITVTAGQSTTAGNLCIIYLLALGGTAPSPTTPASWTERVNNTAVGGSREVGTFIYDYINNPGSISSVAITVGTDTWVGLFCEFTCTNVASATADKTGTVSVTTAGTVSAATSSTITANDELAVVAVGQRFSSATSLTFASGSGFTSPGNFNNGSSNANHGWFDYELDTGGSSSGTTITDAVTGWTTGTGTAGAVISTYAQGTGAATIHPEVPNMWQAVARSAYY